MREKEKLKNLIEVLRSFIKAAADTNVDDWFKEIGDAQLYSMSASSPDQNSSPNSGSPESEENKD